MRVDKFLWFVRLYKTRTDATEAVKNNRVLVRDTPIKPSREVEINDVLTVKRPPAVYTFRIKGFPKSRVGAKLVADYLEDLTPQAELEKLETMRMASSGMRDRGTGRPTKKERRALDLLLEDYDISDEDEE